MFPTPMDLAYFPGAGMRWGGDGLPCVVVQVTHCTELLA